ncbi:hypothetical protein PENTCL1PPCAC_3177, partial [Pristionchus entomophagus]
FKDGVSQVHSRLRSLSRRSDGSDGFRSVWCQEQLKMRHVEADRLLHIFLLQPRLPSGSVWNRMRTMPRRRKIITLLSLNNFDKQS